MTWLWRREPRKTTSAQPRRLASATPGIAFEANITVWWRPKRRSRHLNLEELVRHDVTAAADKLAQCLEATDLPAAQDAINAAVGDPHLAENTRYRLVKVEVHLSLSTAAREILAQRHADAERIRRLHFLKTHLYDDPALVVLDRLETHSERPSHNEIEYIQRLARSLHANESWWRPLLEQWEQLGEGFTNTEMQHRAMTAILNSLAALKGD
ncbi:MAG TPA: hypothetical protein VE546_19860 [Streptomyces sp.]|uniref:hypothetical protein n=1 Tax=Streptomyces sp. TaxID=1931 RepID=UPI002D677075|nr:hypothetical protein [Streptomyces sp.]HZG05799.1 hypothetical protein [Streptomyces sp.]